MTQPPTLWEFLHITGFIYGICIAAGMVIGLLMCSFQ